MWKHANVSIQDTGGSPDQNSFLYQSVVGIRATGQDRDILPIDRVSSVQTCSASRHPSQLSCAHPGVDKAYVQSDQCKQQDI